MASRLLLAGLLAAVVTGGSCIQGSCVQFDGQSLLLRHDPERDRLDALLIYRDLHTTGDSAEGIAQLEAIRAGQRTFAVAANFPLLFELDELAREKRDPKLAAALLMDTLSGRITVRNGSLWQDAQGRVCGAQLVRLEGIQDALRAVNGTLHESLSGPGGVERFAADWHLSDTESIALLRKAATGHFTFAGLRGSAIWFALPVSDVGLVSLKRELFDNLEQALAASKTGSETSSERAQAHATLQVLALNEWALERSPGFVTFVLGAPHAATVELTVPPIGLAAPGVPNVLARRGLTDALRPRGWSIGGGDGEAAARAAFDAFILEP